MTTYEVASDETGHHVTASWPDLPERASHPVATFQELKLAGAARSVLDAASRYRWRRWLQLIDGGVFSEEQAGPDPTLTDATTSLLIASDSGVKSGQPSWLPRLSTSAVLGDSPMSQNLEQRIKDLIPDSGEQREPVDPDSPGLADRVPLGNLRPLLWRDWSGHLQADEHDRLAAELDEDVAATTGLLSGRARQIGWYLAAELLIDEDQLTLMPGEGDDESEERKRAFQESLVQLLSDLVGLRVESTAVDRDLYNEGLLRLHSPRTVVGFWLDEESWYYGWPDPDSPDSHPIRWRHAGTLPNDTTIGDLASFVTERVAQRTWPFGDEAPGERRRLFGGRSGRR
jgi:hypothetical protein